MDIDTHFMRVGFSSGQLEFVPKSQWWIGRVAQALWQRVDHWLRPWAYTVEYLIARYGEEFRNERRVSPEGFSRFLHVQEHASVGIYGTNYLDDLGQKITSLVRKRDLTKADVQLLNSTIETYDNARAIQRLFFRATRQKEDIPLTVNDRLFAVQRIIVREGERKGLLIDFEDAPHYQSYYQGTAAIARLLQQRTPSIVRCIRLRPVQGCQERADPFTNAPFPF